MFFKIFQGNILDIRWKRKYILPSGLDPSLYASLFWGFYESAEKRLINKYLPNNLPVIELGASLGIVSNHISTRLKAEITHIMVEMNSFLIPYIKKNHCLKLKNNINAIFVNQPIAYGSEKVQIQVSRNTTESVVLDKATNTNNQVFMQSTQLNILHKHHLNNEDFTLVCDIEGTEIQILLNDRECLSKCLYLIIELHDTYHFNKYYSIEDMIKIIVEELKFNLEDRDGNVFYFKK